MLKLRKESEDARWTRADRALADRICKAFRQHLELSDLHDLDVYAYRGFVTLYGSVRSELDRELLVHLLRQMPGVEGVSAQVKVEPDLPFPGIDGEEGG